MKSSFSLAVSTAARRCACFVECFVEKSVGRNFQLQDCLSQNSDLHTSAVLVSQYSQTVQSILHHVTLRDVTEVWLVQQSYVSVDSAIPLILHESQACQDVLNMGACDFGVRPSKVRSEITTKTLSYKYMHRVNKLENTIII